MQIQVTRKRRSVLAFDLETVAAGYADPQWVPHRVTCWAYAWEDGDVVVDALPVADFYNRPVRARFLAPLIDQMRLADVVSGHNILRFDLGVLGAEVMRVGLPRMPRLMVQDTMRLPRSKGFKKGQDNLGVLLNTPEGKLSLNWEQWEAAYAEPDLRTVKERAASDVREHIQIRERMREAGWLSPAVRWNP